MSTEFIPNYIRRTVEYNPRDILTAQEYNAILNLIIAQGDHNSEWLDYLQNEGIPEIVEEIGIETIREALSEEVQEEINVLAASVTNKTTRYLERPIVSLINRGIQVAPWTTFKTLLDSKNLTAAYTIATNLVGTTAAYPTLTQLNDLKTAGNEIIASSTGGSYSNTTEAATTMYSFMDTNGFNASMYCVPSDYNGEDTDAIQDIFSTVVIPSTTGISVNPIGIIPGNIGKLVSAVIINNASTVADIKAIIDDVIAHNKYLVLVVNTDSSDYDASVLEEILDYALTFDQVVYNNNAAEVYQEIYDTIGNSIIALAAEDIVINNKITTMQANINSIILTLTSISSMIPSGASDQNKLVTQDTISTLSAAVNGMSGLIPSTASSDNKLITQDDITDKFVRRVSASQITVTIPNVTFYSPGIQEVTIALTTYTDIVNKYNDGLIVDVSITPSAQNSYFICFIPIRFVSNANTLQLKCLAVYPGSGSSAVGVGDVIIDYTYLVID